MRLRVALIVDSVQNKIRETMANLTASVLESAEEFEPQMQNVTNLAKKVQRHDKSRHLIPTLIPRSFISALPQPDLPLLSLCPLFRL